MRLGISKGMHRQAATSWGFSDSEKQERNHLFWTIYSLDRYVTSRCGRPHVSRLNPPERRTVCRC